MEKSASASVGVRPPLRLCGRVVPAAEPQTALQELWTSTISMPECRSLAAKRPASELKSRTLCIQCSRRLTVSVKSWRHCAPKRGRFLFQHTETAATFAATFSTFSSLDIPTCPLRTFQEGVHSPYKGA